MGFPTRARKLRDRIRKQYTDETGLSDWKAPEFQRWLVEHGELEKQDLPEGQVIRVTVTNPSVVTSRR